MPLNAQLVLTQRQRLATGHTQLPLHQVEPGDGFGHRMLHLQAGVHLHEIKLHGLGLVVARLLDDELHRARTHIVHRLGRRHCRCAHLRAQGLGHARRRGFFQHFLVTTLHRTIALEQVDAVAVRVAKHLDLDVARALHIFFNQHRVAAKAVHGLALATGQGVGKICRLLHRPHALAAAACAGLDQHGVANAIGLALQQGRVLVGPVVAGHQGHTGFFHQLFRFGFQAHGLDGRRRWPNEHQPRRRTGFGKVRVLAQKAIARVHRLCARVLCDLQDALPAQVAVLGCAAADVHRLVTGQHVFGVRVGVGIHRHGLDAQAARSGGHTAGNFATVGDENFLKHAGLSVQAMPCSHQPIGFAFLQKRLHAFFALGTGADVGNALHGAVHQRIVDVPPRHLVQQVFACLERVGAGRYQGLGEHAHLCVQRVSADHLVHQSQAVCLGGAETLGR